MATTTTDDGFHEIQLNGKQLVFLFMAVTVVSVVIFLFGVLVGRGVQQERSLQADQSTATEPAGDVADAAPPIPTTPSGGPPVTSNEELTYARQLEGKSDVVGLDSAKRTKATETPKAEPKPPAAKPSPDREDAPAKSASAAKPSEAPAQPERTASPDPSAPGFTIQVAALRDRSEAESVVQRLSGKGYAAYLVAPQAGTPAVYRVRVGKFKERREADTVAARLQKEEQFKPWIVR